MPELPFQYFPLDTTRYFCIKESWCLQGLNRKSRESRERARRCNPAFLSKKGTLLASNTTVPISRDGKVAKRAGEPEDLPHKGWRLTILVCWVVETGQFEDKNREIPGLMVWPGDFF